MATRTVTFRTDDVTGEEGETVESHSFILPTYGSEEDAEEGILTNVKYTLDAANSTADAIEAAMIKAQAAYVKALAKALKPYTEVATVKTPRQTTAVSRDQAQAIREWAGANGFSVAPRGRIPSKVLDAYNEAHADNTDSE